MRNKLIMLWIGIRITMVSGEAQSLYTISGTIRDEHNQAIVGASVYVVSHNTGCISDRNGNYSIHDLEKGTYYIRVSYVGYQTHTDTLILHKDTVHPVRLFLTSQILDEIVIKNDYIEIYKKVNPLPIQTIDNIYIKQHLGNNMMKSLEQLPGISTMDIGSGQSKPVIRGLGFNRIVVIDKGIKHEGQQWGSDHGLEIDQYAVENMEIIKGPASLRYGSDAIGGVIHIKENDLPDSNSIKGSIDLTGKTNNNLLGTSLALQVRKNIFFTGLRFTLLDYGDYKVPTDSVDIYSYRAGLYKNSMRNTAGKEHDLNFTIGIKKSNFQSTLNISNYYNKAGLFANAHGLEPRNVDEDTQDASSRDILYPYQSVNHFKVLHNTAWTSHKVDFTFDWGFQRNFRQERSNYVTHAYMPVSFPDSLGFDSDLERQFDKYIYSGIVGCNYRFNNKIRLESGLNADFQINRISGREFIIPAYNQLNSGLFLLSHFTFTKKSNLQIGIRYDYGYLHTKSYSDWFPSPLISGLDTSYTYLQRSEEIKRLFSNISASIGYMYSLENWLIKINLGRSFRMPTAKELAANGVNYSHFSYEIGDADLHAEISYQLDADVEFKNRKFSFSIEPFVNYFSNYIYLNPTSDYDRLYGNGNQIYEYTQCEVFRCGGECTIAYQIIRSLHIGCNAEYVFARQLSGEKKGYALPFSPPTTLIFDLTYQPMIKKIITEPYCSVDIKWVAPQTDIVPPEETTDGYCDISLYAGFNLLVKQQSIQCSMQLQNLLNSTYYNHTGYYRLIHVPEPGRNFIFSINIPFSGFLNKKNQKQ